MEIINSFNPGFWQAFLATLFSGGVIGLERQMRGKPAGIRTAILICFGTQLFIYMGSTIDGSTVDASRVLGQVVTGIGFLGAGVMFANAGGVVVGVTTAAVIWVLAAIGAMIGLGHYMSGCIVATLTVSILYGCELIEQSFRAMRRGAHARINGNGNTATPESESPTEGDNHEQREP
ncbi:MAG: MgtC/SapB family protein [Mariprofundaceae bacterium]|nr:MgtC/SapB family protein [Mariprofundaceae bacterium]